MITQGEDETTETNTNDDGKKDNSDHEKKLTIQVNR